MLQEDIKNRVDTESEKHRLIQANTTKGNHHAETDTHQFLFGHICRMHDNRKIKELMLGRMEGTKRRGRPHREWLDDTTKWSRVSLQQLSQAAMDRRSWKSLVKVASHTYGR